MLSPASVTFSKTILVLTAVMLSFTNRSVAQLKTNFTADKPGGCSPVAIAFTNTTTEASSGATYSWDFGNGNSSSSLNAGALYSNEKFYTVTLTVQEGAQTSVKTQLVNVYAKPLVTDVSVTLVNGCLPVNAVFTATATAGSAVVNSYFWDFGDGYTQQGYSAVQQHVSIVGMESIKATLHRKAALCIMRRCSAPPADS